MTKSEEATELLERIKDVLGAVSLGEVELEDAIIDIYELTEAHLF